MSTISQESLTVLDELVASECFQNREAAIDAAVRRLQEELEADGHRDLERISDEEWCKQFEAWASSHRALARVADDRRQSIYPGRGE